MDTPFMRFWAAVNEFRASKGRAEMLFGEAHDLWASATGEGW